VRIAPLGWKDRENPRLLTKGDMALDQFRRYSFQQFNFPRNSQLLALWGLPAFCLLFWTRDPNPCGRRNWITFSGQCRVDAFRPAARIQIAYGTIGDFKPVRSGTPKTPGNEKKVLIPGDPENGNWKLFEGREGAFHYWIQWWGILTGVGRTLCGWSLKNWLDFEGMVAVARSVL